MVMDIHKTIELTKQPEDLFGSEDVARQRYRETAKEIHPDVNDDPRCVSSIQKLNELWSIAEAKMQQGIYGTDKQPKSTSSTISFKNGKYTYTLLERIYVGGTAGIFNGLCKINNNPDTIPILVKVPHSSSDNDLMNAEYDVLSKVSKQLKLQKEHGDFFIKKIPNLISSSVVDDGEQRRVNVFTKPPGKWYTLEDIRKKYPCGITTRQATFIFNRIMESLTPFHTTDVVHGAVTPNHILINAETHDGILVDWTAATRVGSKIPYVDSKYENFHAPDSIAIPSMDVYSAAQCVVYLLNETHMEKPLLEFFNRCLQPKCKHRPKNAILARQEFETITKKVFGPKKFVELKME